MLIVLKFILLYYFILLLIYYNIVIINNFFLLVNRVKEGTGVVINISENDGSNVIRIEGNLAGVLKAQTVCNICFIYYKYYIIKTFL